ncbi:MAG: ATP-binding protein, partial [Propionibacteriaceae bacterium]|nr:ATP-binding protein [Propionibacteriaceae bacterium]
MTFVGRQRELALLHAQLAAVRAGSGSPPGRAIIVAGRRRAGKSRLVQEFCETSGVASVVFQATHNRTSHAEMADFVDAIATSGLPEASLVAGLKPQDWNQALRTLAGQLPTDRPTIVVIDEVPWLTAGDKSFEGALQTVWDQHLGRKPVLLLLIGSDQSVMEGLTDHDRPFFGRAAPLRVDPLTPAEVQDLTELPPAAAIDAWLITGGFPVIATSWEPGETRRSFLARALADPLSPLLVSGELTLLGEFPRSTLARAVLEAIGTGERTFSLI